jgi:hypothetical protein
MHLRLTLVNLYQRDPSVVQLLELGRRIAIRIDDVLDSTRLKETEYRRSSKVSGIDSSMNPRRYSELCFSVSEKNPSLSELEFSRHVCDPSTDSHKLGFVDESLIGLVMLFAYPKQTRKGCCRAVHK